MVTPTTTERKLSVKRGLSVEKDEQRAVKDFYKQIEQPNMSGIIFFASSKYDPEKLGEAMRATFDVPVIGCTTAGEITPMGYSEGSLTGVSIASDDFKMHTFSIKPLRNLNTQEIVRIGERAEEILNQAKKKDNGAKAFALLLIDGLSVMEETVTANLHQALDNIPIIGGSAGDDVAFEKTYVYAEGEFVSDAAVMGLCTTSLQFETFKTQHFVPTDKKLVITEADPKNRTVEEINGQPAAEEYASLVGLTTDELTPMVFSKYPVVLKIGGEYFVRSIQKVNDDGGLTFYCAIDNGLVLTLATGVDIVENLENCFNSLTKRFSNPQLIIGCECILRRLEVLEKELTPDVDERMKRFNVIGFHTYGEQFNSVHVNQTFTGIALGE
ncbi:MAG: FIST domain containing protein [candidate division Zixibacteria bacterium]|nr:FIST domain containing protein [candidate division Zixibacteria bacterium]